MTRWITSAKLFVLGAFLVVSLATAAYEIYYVWPIKRCDARGAWWDSQDRQCLTPMPIWRITGRKLVSGPPETAPETALPAGAAAQRVPAGTQSTSPSPLSLANRAATNNRSDNRLR